MQIKLNKFIIQNRISSVFLWWYFIFTINNMKVDLLRTGDINFSKN